MSEENNDAVGFEKGIEKNIFQNQRNIRESGGARSESIYGSGTTMMIVIKFDDRGLLGGGRYLPTVNSSTNESLGHSILSIGFVARARHTHSPKMLRNPNTKISIHFSSLSITRWLEIPPRAIGSSAAGSLSGLIPIQGRQRLRKLVEE